MAPSPLSWRTVNGPVRAPVGLALLAALLVVLATGCSSDTTTPSSAASSTGSTRSTPSSSTPSPSAPSLSAAATYGGYPSFLPSDTVDGGFQHRVVNASARRPALATQGDTVRVRIGKATVLATVSGPAVPVAGQQYQAPDSPATWQVVLRQASTALPLDPAAFQAIDEQGAVQSLQPQGRVRAVIRPGQVVRFKLFSPAFATGEGRLRWIPVGHLAPVEWDFVVETD